MDVNGTVTMQNRRRLTFAHRAAAALFTTTIECSHATVTEVAAPDKKSARALSTEFVLGNNGS